MTAARRTLEEIEAARAKIPALDFEMFNDLLAIAQGQRGELERLRSNASTAAFDKVNDQLREANEDNRILSERLGSAVKTIHGMDGELFLLKEIETILQKLPQDVFGGAFWEQLERIRRHREGIGTKK